MAILQMEMANFQEKGAIPALVPVPNVRQAFNIQKPMQTGYSNWKPKGRRLCMTDVMYLRISITSTRTKRKKEFFIRTDVLAQFHGCVL